MDKNNHQGKKGVAIIITLVSCLFCFQVFVSPAIYNIKHGDPYAMGENWWFVLLIGFAFIGAMIAVLQSRIKELDNGNEDDLDQY